MIKSIKHKALRNYWGKGDAKGISPMWLAKVSRALRALDAATKPQELNLPSYYFHELSGRHSNRYSLRITGNYRMTFGWLEQDAIEIDLEDYH